MSVRCTVPVVIAFLAAVLAGCTAGKELSLDTAQDRFRYGMELYKSENYLEAVKQFEIIRLQFPGSAIADSAQFYSGMSRFKREEYQLAVFDFQLMIRNQPDSPLAPDAYYMIAKCYVMLSPPVDLDQNFTLKALDALQTFMELYPSHEKVAEARQDYSRLYRKLALKEFKTGVLYRKLGYYRAALVYFNTVIDRYYSTDLVDDAMVEKIEILVEKKRYAEARTAIREFMRKYPDSPLLSRVESAKEIVDRSLGHSTLVGEAKQNERNDDD
ncbi:MAG: outer membrane protein assembly factor BamD [Chlorobi bacterium]|nr:outer membrane protein assembly factor BamD [Chlorobiota bacterium]